MGVIQRQAVKGSAVKMVSSAFGILSTVVIYSQFKEYQGFYNSYLYSSALLLSGLTLWGGANTVIRFHPANTKTENQGILIIQLALLFFNTLLVLSVILLYYDKLIDLFWGRSEASDPRLRYAFWILPLAFILGCKSLVTNYVAGYQRIVVPALINNLGLKVSLAALVLLIGYQLINYDLFALLLVGMNVIALLTLVIYLRTLDRSFFKWPKWKSFWQRKREILSFNTFAMLNFLSAQLAIRVDALMVALLIDLKSAGAYYILVTLVGVIDQFAQTISSITSPLLARDLSSGFIQGVKKLYQSSSTVLMIVSVFLSALIISNIHDVIQILPKGDEFPDYFWVCLFMCLGQVINSSTSTNSHIIVYSQYYRVSLYILLTMAVINVILNYLLIPEFQLKGAAISTFISWGIVNILRTIYVKWRFGILPFGAKTLWVFVIGVGLTVLSFALPDLGNPWINMIVKSLLISALFVGPIYYVGFSDDFNNLVDKNLGKLGIKLPQSD